MEVGNHEPKKKGKSQDFSGQEQERWKTKVGTKNPKKSHRISAVNGH